MVAFSVSQGEEPHDWYRGCPVVRPRNWVFRYLKNERELALALRWISQYSSISGLLHLKLGMFGDQ